MRGLKPPPEPSFRGDGRTEFTDRAFFALRSGRREFRAKLPTQELAAPFDTLFPVERLLPRFSDYPAAPAFSVMLAPALPELDFQLQWRGFLTSGPDSRFEAREPLSE